MEDGRLGKNYPDGTAIICEGEPGDRMFIIQSGRVRVTRKAGDGTEIHLIQLKEGDFFGEMALIEGEVRSATVRAVGEVSLLSIDKRNFHRRVHEDPSLAYRILERMSQRVRDLTAEVARLKAGQPRH
jgi:CRP-like cAMP-binding protein